MTAFLRSTVLLAALAATLPAPGGATDRSLPAVDAYGLDLVAYATVRRDDGTYRRMLVSPEALPPIASGGPPPDGTRILMETYYTPGSASTVFHMQKVGGRWLYGSFPTGRPDLSVRAQATCLSCHAGAADSDLVFTLPSLRAAAGGAGPSDFRCERGGRTPCPAETYRDGAQQ